MAWEIARIAIAAVAVLFLPGWLLLDAIRWEFSRSVRVSLIPTAFALSVAVVTLLGVVGHLVGVGLDTVLYVILAIDCLALLRIVALIGRRGGRAAASLLQWVGALGWAEVVVVGFAAVAAGVAAWAGTWLSQFVTADTFYHLAAVRSLISRDEVLVSRLIYADSPSGLDPASGTWHLVLALIARLSGLDIVVVWTYLPPLMALLLVLAFYMFALELLRNHWWALAATVIQFTVFMEMDFRASPYPNVIAKAMLWVGLAAALRYLWLGDRRGLWVAGAMAFTLASVHMFVIELYLLSLGVFAGAALLLVRWRPHLLQDLRRLAVLVGSGVVLAVPMVFARAQGARLVSTVDTSVNQFRELVRVAGALEDNALFSRLGDGLLSPITSLGLSEWAADRLYIVHPRVLAADLVSTETVTYLLVLLLLPGLFLGRRLNIYLVSTTLVVPFVLLNPLLVSLFNGRVGDQAFLRLPQLVPSALVWVAVLAPLASRLGRLARTHRVELLRRYLVTVAHRQAVVGRFARAVPAPALVTVQGVLFGAVAITVAIFAAADIRSGLVDTYLSSEGNVFSVPSSKSAALKHEEGVFGYLRENAPPDAVVLADEVSSYYISGLVGTPVVAVKRSHSPRRVEIVDGPQRRLDAATALEDDSLKDSLEVVRQYEVTYVVTDAPGPTVFDEQPGMFRVVYEDGESRLYEFLGADD